MDHKTLETCRPILCEMPLRAVAAVGNCTRFHKCVRSECCGFTRSVAFGSLVSARANHLKCPHTLAKIFRTPTTLYRIIARYTNSLRRRSNQCPLQTSVQYTAVSRMTDLFTVLSSQSTQL